MNVARKWIGMAMLFITTGCATPFADSSRTGRTHDADIEHERCRLN